VEYVRISRGLNKYTLEPINADIQSIINKDPNSDYYESLYVYREEHVEHFKKTKSLAGIKGLITKKLVFDFDDKLNIENAKHDAVELCSRLIQKGIPQDQIQVYFSGKKGFHVQLFTDQEYTRPELENTIKNLGKDLESMDLRIVDEQRIIRIPMTKHNETGLYKIPLTVGELSDLSIEQIKDMSKNAAKNQDIYFDLLDQYNSSVVNVPQEIRKLKTLTKKEKELLDENIVLQEKPNFSNKPRHLSASKYALQEGFFEAGERHEAFMILASTYRGLGYSKEIAYNMLKATNRLQSRRTGQDPFSTDELWNNIVEYIFGTRWQGGTYSDKENALLQKTVIKFDLKEQRDKTATVNVDNIKGRFLDFAKNFDQNRIKLGIPKIDEDVLVTTGMFIGVLGAPGSSKTTLAINTLEFLSQQNEPSYFFSLDMTDNLMFTRFLQRYSGYNMKQILHRVQHNTIDQKLSEAFRVAENNFKNVGFNFQSGPTVEDIEKNFLEYQERVGKKIRFVVVDYLEKIRGPFSDATANSGFIAARLADFARDHDVALMVLLQPQKSAGDASEPLLSLRKVKGASVIEQDARIIFTIWRPGFNPDDNNANDKFVSIAVVKNNMGNVGKYNFRWDGLLGTYRDLTMDEEAELEEIINEKEQKRQIDQTSGYGRI